MDFRPENEKRLIGLRLAGLVLVLLTVVVSLRLPSPSVYFERPATAAEKKTYDLINRIKREQKIKALWTFDAFSSDIPNRALLELDPPGMGAFSTTGRFGEGRKLNGKRGTGIPAGSFTLPYSDVSVTAWIKPDRFPDKQDIFVSYSSGIAGFRLDSGHLCFDQPERGKGYTTISIPFDRFGEFTHIAAVSRRDGQRLELYVNGVLKATKRFTPGDGEYLWRAGVG